MQKGKDQSINKENISKEEANWKDLVEKKD